MAIVSTYIACSYVFQVLTEVLQALAKKVQAEEILAKLEKDEISRQLEMDKEDITEDEKYMLRKVGLKMKPFLLMGKCSDIES